MDAATVRATIVDKEHRVTYHVLAYREITRAEAITAIRLWTASRKRKPKKGSTISIVTILGFNDS